MVSQHIVVAFLVEDILCGERAVGSGILPIARVGVDMVIRVGGHAPSVVGMPAQNRFAETLDVCTGDFRVYFKQDSVTVVEEGFCAGIST